MKNLYDFNKNIWHAKFFEWMWDVNPVYRFKTMCPYFWQFVGSIIILPLIIVVKIINVLFKSLTKWIDNYTDRYADRILRDILEQIKNAKTNKDYYDIYNSKCFSKFSCKINENDYNNITSKFFEYKDELYKKKGKRQQQIDEFKYGKGGTILSYIIGALVLSLIGWGLYEVVHLFTWNQFVQVLIWLAKLVGIVIILFFIGWGSYKASQKLRCDSWIHKIVFWKYIGNFIIAIVTGFVMAYDMICNLYRKSCPTIHWK